MSSELAAAIRSLSIVLVVFALGWLVLGINAHADKVQRGVHFAIDQRVTRPLEIDSSRPPDDADAGLNNFDIIECMCGSPASGVGGWIGLWLVTAIVGGVPTAILLRFNSARHG